MFIMAISGNFLFFQRKPPKKLISFHSGEITGLQCSPVSHRAASISENGELLMTNVNIS